MIGNDRELPVRADEMPHYNVLEQGIRRFFQS